MTLITGNTYPHRQQLRAMGGEWDAQSKGWRVPEDAGDRARALVAAAPRGVSYYTRFSSGAEVYVNRNGRCEDSPCCGCCS